MEIDVGVTFEEMEEKAADKPIEGTFHLRVESLHDRPHVSEKGNWVIPVRLLVEDDPDHAGRSILHWLVVGTFSFRDFCRATGFRWTGTSFNAEDIVGLDFWAEVGIVEGQRGPMSKVQRILQRQGGSKAQLDDIPF
jgi:hypothetical protein